jgi:ketosteroid isomerase-like protein
MTTNEVLTHHARAMIAGDLDEIVSDYADDARFITADGVLRGKDGVREGFTRLFEGPAEPALRRADEDLGR